MSTTEHFEADLARRLGELAEQAVPAPSKPSLTETAAPTRSRWQPLFFVAALVVAVVAAAGVVLDDRSRTVETSSLRPSASSTGHTSDEQSATRPASEPTTVAASQPSNAGTGGPVSVPADLTGEQLIAARLAEEGVQMTLLAERRFAFIDPGVAPSKPVVVRDPISVWVSGDESFRSWSATSNDGLGLSWSAVAPSVWNRLELGGDLQLVDATGLPADVQMHRSVHADRVSVVVNRSRLELPDLRVTYRDEGQQLDDWLVSIAAQPVDLITPPTGYRWIAEPFEETLSYQVPLAGGAATGITTALLTYPEPVAIDDVVVGRSPAASTLTEVSPGMFVVESFGGTAAYRRIDDTTWASVDVYGDTSTSTVEALVGGLVIGTSEDVDVEADYGPLSGEFEQYRGTRSLIQLVLADAGVDERGQPVRRAHLRFSDGCTWSLASSGGSSFGCAYPDDGVVERFDLCEVLEGWGYEDGGTGYISVFIDTEVADAVVLDVPPEATMRRVDGMSGGQEWTLITATYPADELESERRRVTIADGWCTGPPDG